MRDEKLMTVEEAVRASLQENVTTVDLGGSRSTSEVGEFLADRVAETQPVG